MITSIASGADQHVDAEALDPAVSWAAVQPRPSFRAMLMAQVLSAPETVNLNETFTSKQT
jgi:hypothetical protein